MQNSNIFAFRVSYPKLKYITCLNSLLILSINDDCKFPIYRLMPETHILHFKDFHK